MWSRLVGNHIRSNSRGSTFRHTLAAVLAEPLALTDPDAPRLSEWIQDHLPVATWPVRDGGALAELEDDVLDALDPPLNLQGMPSSDVRARLSELRRLWPRG